jgi:hypothetical protein
VPAGKAAGFFEGLICWGGMKNMITNQLTD